MRSRMVGAGVAVAVVGTGLVAAPAPVAQAAAKPCAQGSWRLTGETYKESGVYRGTKWSGRTSGGAGVRMTLGSTSASYDFDGSKREHSSGYNGRTRIVDSTLNRGRLKINVKVTGGAKGTFVTNPKTATGNAHGKVVQTKPKKLTRTYKIASNLRKGLVESLVPARTPFTCSRTRLVLTRKFNSKNKYGTSKGIRVLTYRRA